MSQTVTAPFSKRTCSPKICDKTSQHQPRTQIDKIDKLLLIEW